jgi:hypothetical protein
MLDTSKQAPKEKQTLESVLTEHLIHSKNSVIEDLEDVTLCIPNPTFVNWEFTT